MMETLASWFGQVLGELANTFISLFMNMMQVDLATMAGVFPLLITGYRMFQAIGIGLIIGIAIYQLLRFFGGQLVDYNDTPARILVRAFIAGMMLWFGGYIINLVVDLAALPYRAFVENDLNPVEFKLIAFDDWSPTDLFIDASAAGTLKSGTVIVLYILVMVVILYNLLKLMLEVLQRYLMVGVLAYTSPLAFATITSKSTSQIFRSYVNVFLGQCALMGITAWMLRLCISGFGFSEGESGAAFRILLTLAMCKIAQRADTYMQSLGVGTVTTTAGMLDDILVGAKALSGNRNKNGASGTGEKANTQTVLGAKAREEAQSGGGFFSNINHPLRHPLRSAYAATAGAAMGWNAAKDEIKEEMAANTPNTNGQNSNNMSNQMNRTARKFGGAIGGIKGAYNSDALRKLPGAMLDKAHNSSNERVKNSADKIAEGVNLMSNTMGAAKDAAQATQDRIAQSGATLTEKAKEIMDAGANSAAVGTIAEETKEDTIGTQQRDSNLYDGELSMGGVNEVRDESGKFILTPNADATENGIRFDTDKNGNTFIKGRDNFDSGSYVAENAAKLADSKFGRDMSVNTLGNPEAAKQFLSTGQLNANDLNKGIAQDNMNKMGQTAMDNTFDKGMSSIVSKDESYNKIKDFSSWKDDNGNRHVSFTSLSKDGQAESAKYSLYNGPQQNENDKPITTRSGTDTWYVHKSDTSESRPAGGLGNNQPSPDPRPTGGSGGDRPSPKPDRPHQDNPAPDNPSKEGPALGDN